MSTLQVYSYYISPFANSRESSKPDFHDSIVIRPLSVAYQLLKGIIRLSSDFYSIIQIYFIISRITLQPLYVFITHIIGQAVPPFLTA